MACWISSEYAAKSSTGHKYAEQLQSLVRELDVEVRWIPGTTNKADSASRASLFDDKPITAKAPCDTSVTDALKRVNETAMAVLKFGDFLSLKSGRDQFSRLKLPALRKAVGQDVAAAVEAAFPSEELQAKCCRWCLRGLDTDKAIRKVKTDAEVSENVRR